MAFVPISGIVPQATENGNQANGMVLKFYEPGTLTPLAVGIDSTGVTQTTEFLLSIEGYTTLSGNEEIPHVDQIYKIVLYLNQADADADDTGSAVYVIDDVDVGDFAAISDPSFADYNNLALALASTIGVAGDFVNTAEYNDGSGVGGGSYEIVSANPGNNLINPQKADGNFLKLLHANEIKVSQAGADGGDNTAAIQAALNFGLFQVNQDVNSTITTKLNVPEDVHFFSHGGSTITKGANIDMFELQIGAFSEGIHWAGVGATFTGRGCLITTGTSTKGEQSIIGGSILDTQGHCVEYTADFSGYLGRIAHCDLVTTSKTTVEAIKLPDVEANGNRRFIDIVCKDGNLCNFAAGANIIVMGCEFVALTFTDNTKKVSLIGNRGATNDITLLGSQHTTAGNLFVGSIIIGLNCINCDIGRDIGQPVIDNSGTNENTLDLAPASYTPLWTATTTDPVIGDGSLGGFFVQTAKKVDVWIRIGMGSTTTFGVGDWSISLPIESGGVGFQQIGAVLCQDNSAAAPEAVGIAIVNNVATTFNMAVHGEVTKIGPTTPFTWADGDILNIHISYLMAAA